MNEKTPELFLKFYASQQEPDFLGLFLENGGSIGAAATTWQTDFSLTASDNAVFQKLNRVTADEVAIPIPKVDHEGKPMYNVTGNTVHLAPSIRLNMSTSRMGSAINGTLVSSIAGQGSEFLYYLIKDGVKHSQVGLVYASWLQHAASVGMSQMRIVSMDTDGKETDPYTIQFIRSNEYQKQVDDSMSASQMIEGYAEGAWKARQVISYTPSPMLTKSVFKDPVGIAGKGYALLHDIVERNQPYSLETLDDLYGQAIKTVFYDSVAEVDNSIENMIADTKSKGSVAAKTYGQTVASATSLVVNYLIAYRSDGRNLVTVNGIDFAGAESWLRQTQRSPVDANDCDGSALMGVGLLNEICDEKRTSDTDIKKYKYLNAVRNTVDPYYQVGLAVVGATAAEATSAGEESTVAGHAIALMLPTMSVLRSMEKASKMTIGAGGGKSRLMKLDDVPIMANARFDAIFQQNTKDKLPEEEKRHLETWSSAQNFMIGEIDALAIEGTTPASSTLYNRDSANREAQTKYVKRQEKAMAKVSPNVMRSLKVLHVGGSASGSTHRFYRDVVEITFPRPHALWSDSTIRDKNAAASQYVMCRHIKDDNNHIREAGATPKDIQLEEYLLVPLISVTKEASVTLDTASRIAEADVVAPRPRTAMELTPAQAKTYEMSLKELRDLKDHLSTKNKQSDVSYDDDDGVTTTHIVALSTLVHNPMGIAQFCKSIKRSATGGAIRGMDEADKIRGLVKVSDDADMGYFVTVSVKIPV